MSDSQLNKYRANHIGASEVSAILGMSPWATAYDVWASKTNKIEVDFEGSEATGIGHMIEDGLLDWTAKERGESIRKNQFRVHTDGIMSATYDALVDNSTLAYEAKTAGIVRGFVAKDLWGEEGTNQVPDHILIQCHAQAIVGGLSEIIVPALIGGRGRVIYSVTPDKEIMTIILDKVSEFWNNNIMKDTPPEKSMPSLDVVRRFKRLEGKRVAIDTQAVKTWRTLKQQEKEIREQIELAESAVLAQMQDAVIGETEIGNVIVTKGKRKGYTVKDSEVTTVRFKSIGAKQ